MDIESIVEIYRDSLRSLDLYFDGVMCGSPDVMVELYWRKNDTDIEWDEKVFTDEATYGFEICNGGRMFWRKNDYSLARVNNGSGDEFYVLLDNSKEIVNVPECSK